jgi:hypothetical protein
MEASCTMSLVRISSLLWLSTSSMVQDVVGVREGVGGYVARRTASGLSQEAGSHRCPELTMIM